MLPHSKDDNKMIQTANSIIRKGLAGFIVLMILLTAALPLSAFGEEKPDGIAAKVTTEKGALKLRKAAGPKEKVIGEIPNGTCILVCHEGDDWCEVSWNGQTGYCKTEFLVLYREADLSLLDYRVLRDGDKGDDVISLKKRLQELGYIRSGATLTNRYTQETAQRVILFQQQTGMTADGVAWQELQAYLFSDKAPVCSQKLPRIRSRVADKSSRVICGCCMGDGCECCNYTGGVYN